jgi:ribosomal protein S18 acetylase RimI-like enzyme
MHNLVGLARERRCGEMFVMTEEANAAAVGTYERAGGKREPAGVMFHWDWRSKTQ